MNIIKVVALRGNNVGLVILETLDDLSSDQLRKTTKIQVALLMNREVTLSNEVPGVRATLPLYS